MDADHFDALTRVLVSHRSRRHLAATAGALLGGLLVRAPFDLAHDALAKKPNGNGNKKKDNKKKRKEKKKSPCDKPGVCCTDKKPGCPAGLKCCGAQCIDQSWCCDNGAAKVPDCGQTCCQTGQKCCGGQCIAGSQCCSGGTVGCTGAEEECCGGTCVNVLLVPLNCNGCQEPQCVNGSFQCVTTSVGVPCGPGCCNPSLQQTCCPFNFNPPDNQQCWALQAPCAACERNCGTEAAPVCCSTTHSCCPNNTCVGPGQVCP